MFGQEFVKAASAYQKKTTSNVPKLLKMDQALEKKRKVIVRSFSLAKDMYFAGNGFNPSKESELKVGADFLESNTVLSQQQEARLIEAGATVRNAFSYLEKMKVNEEKQNLAKKIMEKMSIEQLTDLMAFYNNMGQTCSEILDKKLYGIVKNC
ncbi:putative glutamine amidotransferase [Bienertia sinuspersici]